MNLLGLNLFDPKHLNRYGPAQFPGTGQCRAIWQDEKNLEKSEMEAEASSNVLTRLKSISAAYKACEVRACVRSVSQHRSAGAAGTLKIAG